jgi:uncharacterized membrane protein
MLPDPLHPAVVHLPIALGLLIPALALLALLAIRLRLLPPRAWAAIALLQAMLVGFVWAAHETGEEQEEAVERVVAEQHIERHEEAAGRLQWIAAAGLLFAVAGLVPGGLGKLSRGAAVGVSLVALAATVAVGRSGGDLVYKYGAANAYVGRSAGSGELPLPVGIGSRHREGHDDDD